MSPPELPSLELVLDVLRGSRDERRAHFDALDQKAGLTLGFAGVLITLSAAVAEPWRLLGVALAVVSGGLALSSFWPRSGQEVLVNVRDYLAAEVHRTMLVLVDTLSTMNETTDLALGVKARRLKGALTVLGLAATALAVGVIRA
jgi:hypothetical protein